MGRKKKKREKKGEKGKPNNSFNQPAGLVTPGIMDLLYCGYKSSERNSINTG